jgi:hypothetical protein
LAAAFLFHCVSLFSHLHKEKKCLRVTPRDQKGFKSHPLHHIPVTFR